MTKNFNF